MAVVRRQIKVEPESNLASIVREAAETGTPLLVDTGDALYEVAVHVTTRDEANAYDSDSFFDIIGISTEGEPTNIALHEEYLADALSPKRG